MRCSDIQVQSVLKALMKRLLLFYAIALVYAVFCSLSFPDDDMDDIPEYVIGPGDVIMVSVWQYEQFNSTATVGPDGKITVHLLGDIPIAGLTREEAKSDIGKRLSKYIKEGAEVTVSVAQFNSQKISVFGQVANPRTIAFSSAPSLIEVVMVQSIPTSEADLSAVQILPADSAIRKPITVDLLDILQKGDTSQLPQLQPGDTVYIPSLQKDFIDTSTERVVEATAPFADDTGIAASPDAQQAEDFVVHVMGAVGSPGSFVSAKRPTLTEILLKAGSVTDNIALKYVRIVRADGTEGDKVIDVDFDEYLLKGDASLLPTLYSGDTIYVPDVNREKIKDVSILITGEVLRPGSYNTREPLDILDAIAMAGGLTPNADPERIRVRRESPDSYEEKTINIDKFLRDIGNTFAPEMIGPGYRIYVPARHRRTSAVAIATRGFVAFLADIALVFSIWRVID
jgi:protein involved in polysaccharide export with SLBB domain